MPKYPEFKSKPIKGLDEENWGKLSANQFNRVINIDWETARAKGAANTNYKAIVEKTDYKARNEKIDFKSHQQKRLNSINFKSRSEKYAKPISQYDKQGNFIRDWESAAQASRELGLAHTNINAVCHKKSKSCGGFIWEFKS